MLLGPDVAAAVQGRVTARARVVDPAGTGAQLDWGRRAQRGELAPRESAGQGLVQMRQESPARAGEPRTMIVEFVAN